jgi:hypothetical protein
LRITNGVKVFLILVFSTIYIYSFSYFGANAFEHFLGNDNTFAQGTKIGSIDLSDKTKQQGIRELTSEIERWNKETIILFTYKERTYEVSKKLFEFNEEETVNNIKQEVDNRAVVSISEEKLVEEIKHTSAKINLDDINVKKLKADLLDVAMMPESKMYTFNLEDYATEQLTENPTISKATVEVNKSNKDLAEFVKSVPTIELKEKSSFSLLEFLEENNSNDFTEETLSIVATGIYGAILPTNISIMERHISKELPSYVQLGYEAKVSEEEQMDLVLLNENRTSYTLELSYDSSKLTIVLKGSPFLYKYSIIKENKKSFDPKTVVQFDPTLEFGQTKVHFVGKKGQLISMYRQIANESGVVMKKELLSEDFYAPMHRIELHSLRAPPVIENPDIELPDEELPEEQPAVEVEPENPKSEPDIDETLPIRPGDPGGSGPDDDGDITTNPKK